jgi:hypothetical protein
MPTTADWLGLDEPRSVRLRWPGLKDRADRALGAKSASRGSPYALGQLRQRLVAERLELVGVGRAQVTEPELFDLRLLRIRKTSIPSVRPELERVRAHAFDLSPKEGNDLAPIEPVYFSPSR